MIFWAGQSNHDRLNVTWYKCEAIDESKHKQEHNIDRAVGTEEQVISPLDFGRNQSKTFFFIRPCITTPQKIFRPSYGIG